MTPYYADDFVTLYHGDCRDLWPLTVREDSGIVVTDPPYGINVKTTYASAGRGRATRSNDYPRIIGDDAPFDPTFLLDYRRVLMWGANNFATRLPDGGCWLVWDKRDGMPSNDNADCELAWMRGHGPSIAPRLYRHRWNGMIKASEQDQRRVHPTQKPVELMAWCLSFFASANGIILDPFAGAGATLVAAKKLGREAIGVEIEERYCAAAAERLSQNVLDFGGAA